MGRPEIVASRDALTGVLEGSSKGVPGDRPNTRRLCREVDESDRPVVNPADVLPERIKAIKLEYAVGIDGIDGVLMQEIVDDVLLEASA